MKKLLYLFGAMALMAGFTACDDNGNGPVDFDDVVDPGFYVVGEAVGVPFDQEAGVLPTAESRMANGYNENSLELDENGVPLKDNKRGKSRLRSGMYEKYVWLEAGKDFELVYFDGDEGFLRYGSALDKDVNAQATKDASGSDFPSELTWGRWGNLTIGEEAPMLQVAESGFYHIILDDASNVEDKADFALIMVNKVKMGVRGAQNGWGNTYGTEVRAEDGTITWTWTEQTFKMAGEKFKFAYNHGWKIALDLAGNIKANTNLGWTSADDHSLLQGGPDIEVAEKGIYTITLTYKMAGGDFKNSFNYTMEKTGTVETNVPENLYAIGSELGNWDWNACVEMTPVKEKGAFWAVRYLSAGSQFKFCAVKSWTDENNASFSQLGGKNDEGIIQEGGNAAVEKEGLYLILVDYDAEKIVVKPAQIYGMGPCFNVAVNGDQWLAGKAAFTVDGQTASIKVDNDGNVRMYVELLDGGADWWRSEWGVTDGKIVYRGNGGDPVTPVTAGQTITLDFNAGTATIK